MFICTVGAIIDLDDEPSPSEAYTPLANINGNWSGIGNANGTSFKCVFSFNQYGFTYSGGPDIPRQGWWRMESDELKLGWTGNQTAFFNFDVQVSNHKLILDGINNSQNFECQRRN